MHGHMVAAWLVFEEIAHNTLMQYLKRSKSVEKIQYEQDTEVLNEARTKARGERHTPSSCTNAGGIGYGALCCPEQLPGSGLCLLICRGADHAPTHQIALKIGTLAPKPWAGQGWMVPSVGHVLPSTCYWWLQPVPSSKPRGLIPCGPADAHLTGALCSQLSPFL